MNPFSLLTATQILCVHSILTSLVLFGTIQIVIVLQQYARSVTKGVSEEASFFYHSELVHYDLSIIKVGKRIFSILIDGEDKYISFIRSSCQSFMEKHTIIVFPIIYLNC